MVRLEQVMNYHISAYNLLLLNHPVFAMFYLIFLTCRVFCFEKALTFFSCRTAPGYDSGHIPGSINIPFNDLLDSETLKIKSEKELNSIFTEHDVDLSKPLVGTCGTGVTSCHIALAAYLCGKEDVMVYDGAWVEWFTRADPSYIISVKNEKTE